MNSMIMEEETFDLDNLLVSNNEPEKDINLFDLLVSKQMHDE